MFCWRNNYRSTVLSYFQKWITDLILYSVPWDCIVKPLERMWHGQYLYRYFPHILAKTWVWWIRRQTLQKWHCFKLLYVVLYQRSCLGSNLPKLLHFPLHQFLQFIIIASISQMVRIKWDNKHKVLRTVSGTWCCNVFDTLIEFSTHQLLSLVLRQATPSWTRVLSEMVHTSGSANGFQNQAPPARRRDSENRLESRGQPPFPSEIVLLNSGDQILKSW